MTGLGAGLIMAFWVGIGSIVTHSSYTKPLPPSCRYVLPSENMTAALQMAFSNVTR